MKSYGLIFLSFFFLAFPVSQAAKHSSKAIHRTTRVSSSGSFDADYENGSIDINRIVDRNQCSNTVFHMKGSESDTIKLFDNASRQLSKNKVRASYNNVNSFFWDLEGNPAYEVPKDSGTHSMFASGIWVSAIDADNEIYVAADRHDYGEQQWFPGPLTTSDGTTDSATAETFNKIWYVDRATIENFKILYENGNITDGSWPVDESIANWPGNGPEGYAQNLAPFIDYNNDGQYNPMDGDYPKMKGDEMAFWIMNDNLAATDTENMGENMGLEMHCTAWANVFEDAYNDSIDLINYVNFLDIVIINRSSRAYYNTFLGFWTDFNLGNPDDDYVGADVMNQAFYVYNGDDYDDDNTVAGYGENPPAQAVVFLKAQRKNTLPNIDEGTYLSKFITFHNEHDYSGLPCTKLDYYNALQGNWQNHQSITYGGYGIGESDVACDYMYPGNSDPFNIGTNGLDVPEYPNWTEANQDNEPGDRNALGSNGPFILNPGESKSFRLAFVWDRYRYGAQSSLDKLKEKLPFVLSWQQKNDFPSNYNFEIVPVGIESTANQSFVSVFPNPASHVINVQCRQLNAAFKIYNATGKIIATGKLKKGNNHFDVQNLSKGIYIIRVDGKTTTETLKLIVD